MLIWSVYLLPFSGKGTPTALSLLIVPMINVVELKLAEMLKKEKKKEFSNLNTSLNDNDF